MDFRRYLTRIALAGKKRMYVAMDSGMNCGWFICSSVDGWKFNVLMK